MKYNKSNFHIFTFFFWTIVLFPILLFTIILILISTDKLGYIQFFEDLKNPKNNIASEIISSDSILLGKYSFRESLLRPDEQEQILDEGHATYFREYLKTYITAEKPELKNYKKNQKELYYNDSVKWFTDPLYGWCNKNFKSDGTHYNIYRDGLKIYTTINYKMQTYAETSVQEHLGLGSDKVEKKPLQEMFFEDIKNRKFTPFHRKITEKQVNAILNHSMKKSERYRIHGKNGMDSATIRKEFHKPIKMKVFSWQGNIDTLLTPWDSIIYYKKFLHAGFISIEPQTGHIKAYVGGIDYKHFKSDHVMIFKRQVGSAFKPFVYTILMNKGYSPCSKVPINSFTFEVTDSLNNKKTWTPKFSDSKYDRQKISLKLSLAVPIFQIGAWLIKQMKAEEIIELIRAMGITSNFEPVPSLFVGAGNISLSEMVGAYSTYANKGIFVTPNLVSGVWVGGEERGIRFSSTGLGQGASMALPIFALYMQKIYGDSTLSYSSKDEFAKPVNSENISDCYD